MPTYEIDSVVRNIKARLNAVDGNWTAHCEALNCTKEEKSSNLHGWETKKGIFCPTCKEK